MTEKLTIVYTKDNCPHCTQAKALLDLLGIPFEERKVSTEDDKKSLLEVVPDARTLPQIFLSGVHIGGNAELQSMNRQDRIFKNKAGQVIIQ